MNEKKPKVKRYVVYVPVIFDVEQTPEERRRFREQVKFLADVTTRKQWFLNINGWYVEMAQKFKCRIKHMKVKEVARNFRFVQH